MVSQTDHIAVEHSHVLGSEKATTSSRRECRSVLVAPFADRQGSKRVTKWALVSSCTAPVLLKVLLHLRLAGQAGTTGNASHEPLEARSDEDLLEQPFYLLESDFLESMALVCCTGRLQGAADSAGSASYVTPAPPAPMFAFVAFTCPSPAAN